MRGISMDKETQDNFNFSNREKELIEQIHNNMVCRGIVDGNPNNVGFEQSELCILAFHIKKIVYEDFVQALKKKLDLEYYQRKL
jgi:hypothetical protein